VEETIKKCSLKNKITLLNIFIEDLNEYNAFGDNRDEIGRAITEPIKELNADQI